MFDPVIQNHNAFDLLLLFIAVVLMPLLSALAGAQLAKRAPGDRRLIARYWQTLARGWIVVALVAAVWHVLGRPFAELGVAPHLGAWDIAGTGAVALVALPLIVQLLRLKTLPPERLAKAIERFERIKVTPTTRSELAVFMLVAITAGVWEELLYRGFLIWFLVPLAGVGGGIVLSALVFGLGHAYQGAAGILFATLIGLAFAALYVLSASLWWLMAAHALIDIYGGLTAWRVKQLAAQQGVLRPP